MEVAIACAKRGHDVTLYEKTNRLEGVFIAAAAPSFKEKDHDLIAWYEREITIYFRIHIIHNLFSFHSLMNQLLNFRRQIVNNT